MKVVLPVFLVLSFARGENKCACSILTRPKYSDKPASARWMAHTLDWGVLSSINSRLDNSPPFGNVYSFVDGPCDESTGTPYFYGSNMDASLADTEQNNAVSFTLSEAALPFTCSAPNLEECAISPKGGDPENPMCARLTLTGKLVKVEPKSDEYKRVQAWLFKRHAAMAEWPEDHDWVIAKLEIEDIWFIDFFGGAEPMSIEDYKNHQFDFTDLMSTDSMGGNYESHHHEGMGTGDWVMLFVIVCIGSTIGNWISSSLSSNGAQYAKVENVEKSPEELSF